MESGAALPAVNGGMMYDRLLFPRSVADEFIVRPERQATSTFHWCAFDGQTLAPSAPNAGGRPELRFNFMHGVFQSETVEVFLSSVERHQREVRASTK